MSEEDPTKCPPSHRWSSCHPPTSDGSVCLATDKCPVCPVAFRSLSAITRVSSDEVQMKMSYQCPTSVLLPSDYLPVAPITLLLVTYQHYICVTNWNVSDQYPTKLVGSEKSTFRPASGQPPASVEGGHKLNIIGSDNGLSSTRRQAIIWTNAGILLIRSLRTNFSEIFIEVYTFSFKKMHSKMSGKLRPFCLDLNVLRQYIQIIHSIHIGDENALLDYQIISRSKLHVNKCWAMC